MPYVVASELHKTFMANVRARRHELGLTVKDMANRLGISQPSYTQIEKGRRVPSLSVIERVSAALEILPVALLIPRDQRNSNSRKKSFV